MVAVVMGLKGSVVSTSFGSTNLRKGDIIVPLPRDPKMMSLIKNLDEVHDLENHPLVNMLLKSEVEQSTLCIIRPVRR